MDTVGLKVEGVGAVRILGLDNPARKNALTSDLYNTLTLALQAADKDESVRVVLLTGTDRVFCSGNDLDDFLDNPIRDAGHPVYRFMNQLSRFEKPVVAAVEGHAVGIGCTLLLHCDFVYAGQSAFFQMPFVQLGICPEFGSTFILPALLGRQRAAELLLLGERFDAATAETLGLINRQVPDDQVMKAALEVAQRLAAAAPLAIQATKKLMGRAERSEFDRAMSAELEVLVEALQGEEFTQAVAAFKAKQVARRKDVPQERKQAG
ncbi:enoyl-CoA hydratase [Marinobacterium maritimum]|uniref:Enoyl-CoA hydratase n=1 Tax=Marinobacterium maritimum TaxID=500162 RepID=A0ABP3TD70_9GAMM